MPDIRFGCTQCGKCCHNHSIPLTLDEAAVWLEEGGNVALFCEASLFATSATGSDKKVEHRRKRSFAAKSGSAEIYVMTMLVGVVSGACRNLDAHMQCRIYERRPLVCRIYPAEISPFISFDITRKACPSEAWESGDVLISNGRPANAHLSWLIEKSRTTDYDDAFRKMQLCHELGMQTTAVADEGYVTYEPDSKSLLTALRKVRSSAYETDAGHWSVYTPSTQTAAVLQSKGLQLASAKPEGNGYMYLHAPARVQTPDLVA